MKDYIAKMNKDKREEIEEGRTDERHTQRVPMYKSNYIVIGPLKTDFHKILGLVMYIIATLCIDCFETITIEKKNCMLLLVAMAWVNNV